MKKTKKFSPDRVMLHAQQALIRDLVESQDLQAQLIDCCHDFKMWRHHEMPGYGKVSPDRFKRLYQVSSFLKRYVAKEDAYSERELERLAVENFIKDQETYGLPQALPRYAQEHLEVAREIVSKILGEFSFAELAKVCRFGKRAACGLPAAEAYLHKRVHKLTFSNDLQLDAFKYCTLDDPVLRRCLQRPQKIPAVSYTTVPKSYKAYRGIAPDMVIGGYLSQGLGRLVRERLESATHINLATAQETHKRVAMHASRTGKYATVDMSKASDSFTWDHISKLVPRSWWFGLRSVRTDEILVGDKCLKLKSYMLMGSGHTFPLQTVMFYALAVASLKLCNVKGKVFVFGDDIIMPTQCVVPFMKSMGKLGFTINKDKTFWTGSFRESCGGDYYRGYDVRPAMPEGTYKRVPRIELCAFYLKVANGLLKRWHPIEIERTITLLLGEVERILGFVPRGYIGVHAEYSAVLYDVPYFLLTPPQVLSENGKLACGQYIIRQKVARICVTSEDPYYWDKLRAMCDKPTFVDWLARDEAFARYCAENSILRRMGLRLPAYLEGDQYRPVSVGKKKTRKRKEENPIRLRVPDKKHGPRYQSGWAVMPILGLMGH